jgi:predicted anti-sigma-YlaC factor YlaD
MEPIMNSSDMKCRELADLLTEYLELALTNNDRQRLEMHLQQCLDCRTYLDQMQRTIQLVGTLRGATIHEAERSRLLTLFHSWRADQ